MVESSALLKRRTPKGYRGFESLPHRIQLWLITSRILLEISGHIRYLPHPGSRTGVPVKSHRSSSCPLGCQSQRQSGNARNGSRRILFGDASGKDAVLESYLKIIYIMITRVVGVLTVCTVWLATGSALHATTTITTNPTNGIVETTADAGETFVVPTNGDHVLSSFAFTMAGAGIYPVNVNAYIFGFNPTTDQVTTSALYSTSLPTVVGPASFQTYTFTPLTSLALTPGATYLAVIQQQGQNNVNGAELDFHYNGPGYQQPVSSAYYSNANNAGPTYSGSAWVTDPTAGNSAPGQLSFTATLVPEPSSVSLIAVAVAGMGTIAAARRRKRGNC